MSCYEWERGRIKIPNTEWTILKSKILKAYNRLIDNDHTIATNTYNTIVNEGKGVRNFNYRSAAIAYLMRTHNLHYDSINRIELSLFSPSASVKRRKPLKPKRKDFPLATNRTTQFRIGSSFIQLDNKNKLFTWNVPENNHAVDTAHEHPVTIAAFNALKDITDKNGWKRNSGGVIIGNDEYNSSSTDIGGGGNYITARFGPLGQKIEPEPYGIIAY